MRKILMFGVIFSLMLLGACSAKEKEVDQPVSAEEDTVQEDINEEEEQEEVDTEPEEEIENEVAADTSGEILNSHIEEETGGEIEVVFTNKNPGLTHSFSEDVTMSIDEYQIVHVTNMNESSKIDFKDEEEGYVLTLKMTLDNQSNEDVYYAEGLTLQSDDATDYIGKKSHFVDRDLWMKDESTESPSHYSKGGSYTGLVAYGMTKAQYDKLTLPTFKVDSLWLNDDTSKPLGEVGVFQLPFTEDGLEKAEATSNLYADKMLTDSIADKDLFFEKVDINETKEIDQVKVTLNGVQYANITPTEAHKDRFGNFGDGPLIALTAKVTLENSSDIPFDKLLIEKTLHIDENRGTMLSQGMLEPTARGEVEPGETYETLVVFLFREDEFQIYKKLELEIGPLRDESAKRLFKEKYVMFDLPMKE